MKDGGSGTGRRTSEGADGAPETWPRIEDRLRAERAACEPPAHLHRDIMASVARSGRETAHRFWHVPAGLWAAAAAGLVVLGVWLAVPRPPRQAHPHADVLAGVEALTGIPALMAKAAVRASAGTASPLEREMEQLARDARRAMHVLRNRLD